MITEKQLLMLLADVFNDGKILDPYPSWVGEVQIFEDTVKIRIDDDHENPKWYSLKVAPIV
tara:strand:- start:50 stop:232 length:183 start_codon:yes stop_codon:yes gene_type:complete